MSRSRAMLRLESLVLLVTVLLAYHQLGGSWLVFAVALLTFDISMLGYAVSDKLGAITYNLGHSMVFPGLALLVGYVHDLRWLLLFALTWLAHINMDRALGYGLKHETFHRTHLGRIGKARQS